VAEEELGRITELFYRTDKARSHTDKGSGLGLAIVSRAVQIMQGTMKISLNDPHGLVFDITFPLKTLQGKDESHE
jgi:signal transduction histidine kinase